MNIQARLSLDFQEILTSFFVPESNPLPLVPHCHVCLVSDLSELSPVNVLRLDNTSQGPFRAAPVFLPIHNMVLVVYILTYYH